MFGIFLRFANRLIFQKKVYLPNNRCSIICRFFHSDVWGMGDYCRQKSEEFQRKGLQGRFHVEPSSREDQEAKGLGISKRKFDDDDWTVMRCAYLKNNYTNNDELPKTRLYRWIRENKKKMAEYDTWYEDKLFRSVVTVDGKKYSSTFW